MNAVARAVGVALTALLVVSGASLVASWRAGTDSAAAADLAQFQPGNIISDALFFDPHALSVAEIQGFLNSKVPHCASGYTCLRDYTETTRTIAASPMCGTYNGAPGESAATIIFKVSQLCGVSSKAILVMLQKEQGLVTSTAPSARRFQAAMGAGCPDTADCDADYYGFFNQVRYGAYLLKRYTQPPGTGAGTFWNSRFDLMKPVGQVSQIQYNPDAGCGTRAVYIANQATHSLYLYTPYTPNSAALAAGYGIGDGCSAYGNRNFFQYYTDWFGSTHGGPAVLMPSPPVSSSPASDPTPTTTPTPSPTAAPTPTVIPTATPSSAPSTGPSWSEVEAARGNTAATAAAVEAISQQVAGLEGKAARLAEDATQKTAIAATAEADLRAATASVSAAQARYEAASARAHSSAERAAALAAALYRSGSSNVTAQLLSETGSSSPNLLDRLGAIGKLGEQFDVILAKSRSDEKEAKSLNEQASRARAAQEKLTLAARSAADTAAAASIAASDALESSQSQLDDLYSQLSALQYSTAVLEREYRASQ